MAFGTSQPKFFTKLIVDVGHVFQGLLFARSQRANGSIEIWDGNLALSGAQFRDQMRKLHNRVRRPVAVVSTVQRTIWTKGRNLDGDHAPAAKNQLRRPILVGGPVTDYPQVGLQ